MKFAQLGISIVGLVLTASASLAGECRLQPLSISSDIPGFPSIRVGLVVDQKTLKITQLEFSSPSDPKGKVARVSSSLVEALAGALNDPSRKERLTLEIDKPMDHVQNIRAQFGQGQFDVDVNPDWLPTLNDVLKLSGRFDSERGATLLIDARRGFNPLNPRAKIALSLERSGNKCEDWHFNVIDGSRSRPISGIVLKLNRMGNLPVGIDEIVPIDLDPKPIQQMIGSVLDPAGLRSVESQTMISDRIQKDPQTDGMAGSSGAFRLATPIKSGTAI